MCGRFTLSKPGEAVAAHFRLEAAPVLKARYNVAPTQPVLAIRGNGGGREAAWLRWGLIPAWLSGPGRSGPLINARAESAASRPAFREAWRRRRCLIPADGFYEWQTAEPELWGMGRATGGEAGGSARRRTARRCWHIRRQDKALFAIAGLWEPGLYEPGWGEPGRDEPGDCEPGREAAARTEKAAASCVLLTTAPNALVAAVHNRMPMVVAPEAYGRWLEGELEGGNEEELLRPWSEREWECVPMHTPLPAE